jgi:membrane fusion protein, macrolide-specific efflux system
MNAPAKRRRRWPWVVVLVAVLGGGFFMMRRSRAGNDDKALLDALGKKDMDSALLATVKRGDLPIDVLETGKVQAREQVEIKSKVAGQVERVLVEEGQKVKKGQLLLKLETTDYRREVERCEADVAQAKIAVDYAVLLLDRRKKGLENRGVAEADVEFAANDLTAKKVSVQRAEVALGAARDRLRYCDLTAPLDGTVIVKGIRPGEVVTPGVQATFEGKPLLTVADLSTLIVKTDLNQIDIAKVKLGQDVSLTLDALPGKKYTAKVTKVAPASIQPKGKDVDVFPIEATLVEADGAIKPGMTADVRVHIDVRPKVLSLPIEAVVKDAGKYYVHKAGVGENGKPKTDKIEVKTGARNDRAVEITEGVEEGTRVLIKPNSSAENEFKM